MTTTRTAVVLLSLCVVLTTAKPAADTSSGLFSSVEQQTTAVNKVMATLPAACTRGSARSIQEAKVQMVASLASCSVFAIIDDVAYGLIDFSDFGSSVWNDTVDFVNSLQSCWKERSFIAKVDCLDTALFSSGNTFETINDAARTFVKQLLVIIPDIVTRARNCHIRSTQEYNLFLDGLVENARTCQV